MLEAVFLVQRLPAWGTTLGSRVARMPKLHLVDAGVMAWLLGLTPEKLARNDPAALTEYGHLVETFAVGEIRALRTRIVDNLVAAVVLYTGQLAYTFEDGGRGVPVRRVMAVVRVETARRAAPVGGHGVVRLLTGQGCRTGVG
ncbi:DUF4143 domain-containing protein [Cryptosporangium phraense]|uniref:DUF4143 domain-containing protein n=1 Tax=Cryptosporangium phraense TaxID=2593070 RepID=UPI00197AE1FF